jgi:hypothetical protein
MMENLKKINMLEYPRGIKTLKQVMQRNAELRALITSVDLWINSSDRQSRARKRRVAEILQFFIQICRNERRPRSPRPTEKAPGEEG